MSTDLAVRTPEAVTLSSDQLQFIAGTEFVPQGLRNNLPAIMACVATGRALGIDDMSALRLIHMVNGRPTFSAELMVQIVRRHGHSIMGEFGDGSCTVVGKRGDNGDTMTVTWTLAMAQRAGLAGKQTWKAYPESMLWARAASQLCRMLFADCFAGGTYTPEELEGAFIEQPVTDAPDQGDEDWTQPDETEPEEDEPEVEFISEPQRKRLWAIAGANDVTEERLRELVAYICGDEVTSTKEIRRDKYDALVAAVEAESLPFG